jgi:hypothetical protein
MRFRWAALLGVALLSACSAIGGAPDSAVLPPGAFGTAPDQDQAALDLAEYVFADPNRTYGQPAEAARAAAAIDYLGGAFSTNPRWAFLPVGIKDDMLQARAELRQTLGIAPDASSQTVVDALLAAANALTAHDEARAAADLRTPVFTLPTQQTLQRLGNMPYVRGANVATREASSASAEVPTENCAQCISSPQL